MAGVPNLTAFQSGVFEKILFEILAERLNFTQVFNIIKTKPRFLKNIKTIFILYSYEVRVPRDIIASGMQLKNGSWIGAIGQIQRKVTSGNVLLP